MRMCSAAFCALAISGITVAAASSAAAQVNLLTNGSFENTAFGGTVELSSGSSSLTGWTIGGTSIDVVRGWQTVDGLQVIDLSGNNAGSISQSVSTLLGNTYQLRFAMAGNPSLGTGDAQKTMTVSITGQVDSTQNFNTTGFTGPNMGWSERVLNFVATSSLTTITFTSLENSNSGPALDNLRLYNLTAAAPEPGSLALVLPALGTLGVVLRKRTRKP